MQTRSRKPVAVITGTTHGIGRVTSRELAQAGYHVTMLCRDTRLAEQVRDEILTEVPRAQVSVLYCDLARLDTVRACALRLRRTYAPLSLLINNAGIVATRRRVTVDGFELTFATNHLGPFLLTGLLLDCLALQARIVTVSSRAH
jgi:NAD(P)-dependent dehydrogenase (short-subunit alcohol dehydrogenase family)